MTYGGELALTWKVSSRWRIAPGYSYLHASLRQDPGTLGTGHRDLVDGFSAEHVSDPLALDPPAKDGVRSIAVLYRSTYRAGVSPAMPGWISGCPGGLAKGPKSVWWDRTCSDRGLSNMEIQQV